MLQWFNFCWYFLLGVSTALDTVGSQAHGEGNPNAVIACCVSAVAVLSLLCIPVVIALLTADAVAETIFFQTSESGKASLQQYQSYTQQLMQHQLPAQNSSMH